MHSPSSIFMVRPASFGYNEQTAATNSFQEVEVPENAQELALKEFDAMVSQMRGADIEVHVFEDIESPIKPDAIFPNNWISLHDNGSIVLYPMLTENRRTEVRQDIILSLKETFGFDKVLDYSQEFEKNLILEGTGSIIFDHLQERAFANISSRTNERLMNTVCSALGYAPRTFRAVDVQGNDIYHTNVVMSIAEEFVIFCSECVEDIIERSMIKSELAKDRELIEITCSQLNAFAGNALEVKNRQGKNILILSKTALEALTQQQIDTINKYAKILAVNIPTIESVGGGSARCMMTGIHNPR